MEIDAENFMVCFVNDTKSQLPSALNCKYRIVSCLKCTEVSKVYLILGKTDGDLYILRVSPIDSQELLIREHRLLNYLHDESFPHPIACFVDGNSVYLVREYIQGTSLSDIIEDSDPMKAVVAVNYAKQICMILAKLHALNPPIIHRDIKPQNFILTPDGKIRLVDLDAVTEKRPACSVNTLSIGTPATAAPEQFGYWGCDERTDVYGIGLLLVFLLTGGYNANVYVNKRSFGSLSRIIRKSLQFDPQKRYKSVAKFERRLTLWQNRWKRRAMMFVAVWLGIALIATILAHFDDLDDDLSIVERVLALDELAYIRLKSHLFGIR